MPRGDGTGPMGMGPMTGRAAGYCAGYATPGFANPVSRRGLGMAWGRGGDSGRGLAMRRGRGRAFSRATAPFATASTREQELDLLRGQADRLKEQLDGIAARIGELERDEK
jgi:hypothetical protein